MTIKILWHCILDQVGMIEYGDVGKCGLKVKICPLLNGSTYSGHSVSCFNFIIEKFTLSS